MTCGFFYVLLEFPFTFRPVCMKATVFSFWSRLEQWTGADVCTGDEIYTLISGICLQNPANLIDHTEETPARVFTFSLHFSIFRSCSNHIRTIRTTKEGLYGLPVLFEIITQLLSVSFMWLLILTNHRMLWKVRFRANTMRWFSFRFN